MNYKRLKKGFHLLSYLQYPLYLLAFFFSVKPYFNGFDYAVEHLDMLIANLNYFFILLGLGIGFSSLQDANKVHFKVDKTIVKDADKAKPFILITSVSAALMILSGVCGYFLIDNRYVNEISIGILVLGISFIGLIKFQLEQVENHALNDLETDE